MKRLFLLLQILVFLFLACDSDSSTGDKSLKGKKFKITYTLEAAYFELPSDAPKYHVYGTDTVLPVPAEKNGLGKLMLSKGWSDGKNDNLTVLGAENYEEDIVLTYKFSFDEKKEEKKCTENDEKTEGGVTYVCKSNAWVKKEPAAEKTEEKPEEKPEDKKDDTSGEEDPAKGCTIELFENAKNVVYDPGTKKCVVSECKSGYVLEGGVCVVDAGCTIDSDCADGEVCDSSGVCVEKHLECDSDDAPKCFGNSYKRCVDGIWTDATAPAGKMCEDGELKDILVDDGACEFGDDPKCDGNSYKVCAGGIWTDATAPAGKMCEDGVLKDIEGYCVDGINSCTADGSLQRCVNNRWKTEIASEGQVCVEGEFVCDSGYVRVDDGACVEASH